MLLSRRAALVAALTVFIAPQALSQDYPHRVVTLIVPFAPGGPTDALARMIQPSLEAKLGVTVVVENVGGGGSTIGTSRVSRAAADGSTLLLHNLAISANPSLYPKLAFDPEKELVAVGFINRNALVLVGRNSLPANSIAELAAWMKSGATAKFAYPGVGSTGHLASALTAQAVGAPALFVPYRGGGPALQDVIAGHADLFFATTQAAIGPITSGSAKGFGITAKEPAKPLPQVPSFVKELSPKLEISYWHALFAPAGTPKETVGKLNAALQAIAEDPKMLKLWEDSGVEPYPKEQRSVEAAQKLLHDEVVRWSEVIRDNKIEGQP
ncbi:MAG TPA: tripartite tricarboxylate transporter substrate-binding protein [Xanthobacteraceae bacterium]|jgi:tripartite-type tricarboxylate transporter receptor subunit TctC